MIVEILAYILPKPWCLLNNRKKVFGFVLLMQGVAMTEEFFIFDLSHQ
jgi:hypothetical protein